MKETKADESSITDIIIVGVLTRIPSSVVQKQLETNSVSRTRRIPLCSVKADISIIFCVTISFAVFTFQST